MTSTAHKPTTTAHDADCTCLLCRVEAKRQAEEAGGTAVRVGRYDFSGQWDVTYPAHVRRAHNLKGR